MIYYIILYNLPEVNVINIISYFSEDVFGLIKNLKVANQLLGDRNGTPATVAEHTQDNQLVLHQSGSSVATCSVLLLFVSIALLFK